MRRARCEAFWRLLHLLGGPGGRVSTIRSCRSEDFGAVFELLRQHWSEEMFREPALRGVFERGLASPRQRYVCGAFDSRVVGFGSLAGERRLRHEGAVGRVAELLVDPNPGC